MSNSTVGMPGEYEIFIRSGSAAMIVTVATEARLFKDQSGRVVSLTEGRSYHFWQRYLDEFDEVRVLARVANNEVATGSPVEGPGVSVLNLTDFAGILGAARGLRRARREASVHLRASSEAAIARIPGVVGGLMINHAKRTGRPYAVEVVGDPYSAVKAANLLSHGRSWLALMARTQMRRQVAGAAAAAFVTQRTLQTRYPPSDSSIVRCYSSVELPHDAFATRDRSVHGLPFRIVSVGTMSQPYKGQDVIIDALALLASSGERVHATLVGDGRLRPQLERLAQSRGVEVRFTGQLGSAQAVRRELDDADLFVMPSRAEGLPRALIEAMARGLPCVGSDVGGIPELLPPNSLVPPGDPRSLARAIRNCLYNEQGRIRMSEENLAKAARYRQDILNASRRGFYSAYREFVEQWYRRDAL